MAAQSVGIDPTITIGAVLVAIPATIAAIASLKAAAHGRDSLAEVKSPNGSTTAQAVQDIKAALSDVVQDVAEARSEVASVRVAAAQHEAKDEERHTALVKEQRRQHDALIAIRATVSGA